ncbi:MAG: hypothetical protein IPP74_07710 [Alphaproteobacteria bacterium]|nr:hypothetical protein [Alphaproteobacteria bacterium]
MQTNLIIRLVLALITSSFLLCFMNGCIPQTLEHPAKDEHTPIEKDLTQSPPPEPQTLEDSPEPGSDEPLGDQSTHDKPINVKAMNQKPIPKHHAVTKPDFTIPFDSTSTTPKEEPDYQALLKNPNRKPLLVLMSYAYGDDYIDPDHLASERIHTIMAGLTQAGLTEESMIPITSWGSTTRTDIPNHSVIGLFIDRSDIGKYLTKTTRKKD